MASSVARSGGVSPQSNSDRVRLLQLAQYVGGAVDRHGGEQLARLGAGQRLDELGCAVELRLVEYLDQPIERHFAEQLYRCFARL